MLGKREREERKPIVQLPVKDIQNAQKASDTIAKVGIIYEEEFGDDEFWMDSVNSAELEKVMSEYDKSFPSLINGGKPSIYHGNTHQNGYRRAVVTDIIEVSSYEKVSFT
jgi:hypothetical protein